VQVRDASGSTPASARWARPLLTGRSSTG
jgi:hypothetical protein